MDPQLERQVETIRNLVESYMRIVSKNVRDLVPKTIMYMMINEGKEFIKAELIASMYATGDQNALMEESVEEASRREEMLRMYNACKEALKIIGDVTVQTVTTPVPPPVNDEWIKPGAEYAGAGDGIRGSGSTGSLNQHRGAVRPPPQTPGINRSAPAPPLASLSNPALANGPRIPARPSPSMGEGFTNGAMNGSWGGVSVGGLPPPLIPNRPGSQPLGNNPNVPPRIPERPIVGTRPK